jgi:hypothetical protein
MLLPVIQQEAVDLSIRLSICRSPCLVLAVAAAAEQCRPAGAAAPIGSLTESQPTSTAVIFQ